MSLSTLQLLLPYTAGDLLDELHKTGRVHSTEYIEAGAAVVASVPVQLVGKVQQYKVGGTSSTGSTSGGAEAAGMVEGVAAEAAAAGGGRGGDSGWNGAMAWGGYQTGDWQDEGDMLEAEVDGMELEEGVEVDDDEGKLDALLQCAREEVLVVAGVGAGGVGGGAVGGVLGGGSGVLGMGEEGQQQQRGRRGGRKQKGGGSKAWREGHQLPKEWDQVVGGRREM